MVWLVENLSYRDCLAVDLEVLINGGEDGAGKRVGWISVTFEKLVRKCPVYKLCFRFVTTDDDFIN